MHVVEASGRGVEDRRDETTVAVVHQRADEIIATFGAAQVIVRVRKLEPPIVGTLAWAGVEVIRTRAGRR